MLYFVHTFDSHDEIDVCDTYWLICKSNNYSHEKKRLEKNLKKKHGIKHYGNRTKLSVEGSVLIDSHRKKREQRE